MNGSSNKQRRRSNILVEGTADSEDEDVELDAIDSDDSPVDIPTVNRVQIVDVSANLAVPENLTQSVTVGSALRRNTDGTFTAPRIIQRKKNDQKVCLLVSCSLRSCYLAPGRLSTVVKAVCMPSASFRL